jgi:hypothetical protein
MRRRGARRSHGPSNGLGSRPLTRRSERDLRPVGSGRARSTAPHVGSTSGVQTPPSRATPKHSGPAQPRTGDLIYPRIVGHQREPTESTTSQPLRNKTERDVTRRSGCPVGRGSKMAHRFAHERRRCCDPSEAAENRMQEASGTNRSREALRRPPFVPSSPCPRKACAIDRARRRRWFVA